MILKVFSNLNDSMILKIIVAANLLEKKAQGLGVFLIYRVWPVHQENQIRLWSCGPSRDLFTT